MTYISKRKRINKSSLKALLDYYYALVKEVVNLSGDSPRPLENWFDKEKVVLTGIDIKR